MAYYAEPDNALLDSKIMERVWPFIYAVASAGMLIGGYQSLSLGQTRQTNTDWIFVSITFVIFLLFPLGAMTHSQRSGVKAFRRPNFRRQPLGWWTDTLQPIRVSLIFTVLYCIGSTFALPHADAQGRMLFYWYLAMAIGLFFGERLVYVIFRERII